MAVKCDRTIVVAIISAAAVIVAASISTLGSCRRGPRDDKPTLSSQTIGDLRKINATTKGNNSPLTINYSPAITITTAASDLQAGKFTNEMRNAYAAITHEFHAALKEERLAHEDARKGTVTPQNNHTALITTPQRAVDLRNHLALTYNAGDIAATAAIAREGTNLYWNIVGPYGDETIKVANSFLEMASACYRVLAEHSMYCKDYETALQLIQRAQDVYPATNTLAIALQAALFALSGDDDMMSAALDHIRTKFPHEARYEIVNTLTKMGYLLPYEIKKTAEGKWNVQPYNDLERDFDLTQKLEFPPVVKVGNGSVDTGPTIFRWVGLNQYQPLDLTVHFRNVVHSMQQDKTRH